MHKIIFIKSGPNNPKNKDMGQFGPGMTGPLGYLFLPTEEGLSPKHLDYQQIFDTLKSLLNLISNLLADCVTHPMSLLLIRTALLFISGLIEGRHIQFSRMLARYQFTIQFFLYSAKVYVVFLQLFFE